MGESVRDTTATDVPAQRNAGGKSAAEVREMFARVAPRYDLLNHLLSLGRDSRWRKAAAREAAGLGAGDVILDVCTGTGDLAFAFHRAAPEAHIVALDFTPAMLALALRKAERMKVRAAVWHGHHAQEPRARDAAELAQAARATGGAGEGLQGERGTMCFGEGDALAVPLPDNTAALAGVAFGVRNVADTDRALREMARVVRPGGKVLVLEFTRPRGWFFGPVYMFYFRRILPLAARCIAETAGDAYRYLPQSVQAFAGAEEITARLAGVGLRDVRATPLTFGVVHLYVGMK